MQINIPLPCHQDWHKMTPNNEGRHCNSCAKTVVDFTGMSLEVVSTYLELHVHESICGRFRESQLVPQEIDEVEFLQQVSKSDLPFLKKIAAVFVFAFFIATAPSFSQSQQVNRQAVAGKIAPQQNQDSTTSLSYSLDSILHSKTAEQKPVIRALPEHQIMGLIERRPATVPLQKRKSKR